MTARARDGGDTVDDRRRSRWFGRIPAYTVGLATMLAVAWPLGRPFAVTMAAAEVLLPALGAAEQGDASILDAGWPAVAERLPDDPIVWAMRAVILNRLGRTAEAEEARQKAVAPADGEGRIGHLTLPPTQ